MTDLIAELAEVVRLSEFASAGTWFMDDPTTADIVTDSGDVAIVLAPEMQSLDLRNGKFAAPNRSGAHQNAEMIIAAVNFIRTHHAEIAEAVNDATLLRYLVRENNKGGRGAFRIVWFDEGDDGFTTTDGVSVDGKDELAIIRIVSAAMRNSAREDGE